MIPIDQYLIYLRKSRKDQELESQDEDTLSRHRTELLNFAHKKGFYISKIYEEVVSGETIAARPEMQMLLRAVETGQFAGVLVMEVERLARGNTRDQGVVAETFQYSGTKIITPLRTYDPNEESDQEYFEFGLFMSRREYKTINRRLQRGRSVSLNEGKYIAGTAPYGYRKVKLAKQKGYTLEIIPEQADVIRRIFDLYVTGEPDLSGSLHPYGTFTIAKRLDAEGIPSPSGAKWPPCTVKDILINPTYAGKLRWSYRPTVKRMEDGVLLETRPVNHEMSLMEGLHPPIVDFENWEAAQKIMKNRSHAPMPGNRNIQNPLAGMVFCSVCGRSMERRKQTRSRDMLMCPTKDCITKGSVLEEVEDSLMDALRVWLAEYQVKMSHKASSKQNKPIRDAERTVSRLENNLSSLQNQRDNLYNLLEQGVYSVEIFMQRSNLLADKITAAETALDKAKQLLESEQASEMNRLVIIPRIERVLEEYPVLDSPQEKHELLSEALQKVVYSKTEGTRYILSNMSLSVFPNLK